MRIFFLSLLLSLSLLPSLMGQSNGSVRGYVYDKKTGEPVPFCLVYVNGTTLGSTSDIEGFYNIAGVPPGLQRVVARYVGYDSLAIDAQVSAGQASTLAFYLTETVNELAQVEVSAEKMGRQNETRISVVSISAKQISALPSVGGTSDIAQYLQVIPGVIFTGDQGGQLYVRGGAPVQNRVLLDGMTLYNPFHSIGFFSVFETDVIRNVDVFTGGFNAQYGGRTSGIIDITTREGNKKRFGGKVEAGPFVAKAVLEGPIVKLKDQGSSISFILTGKTSYLKQTGTTLYPYLKDYRLANDGLPFSFTDVYGKVSFNAKNGTRFNVFGFNFRDEVNLGSGNYSWMASGLGANFKIVPGSSKMLIGGRFSYSNYDSKFKDASSATPRRSFTGSWEMAFDFTTFGKNTEFKYGIEAGGNNVDFEFTNGSGITIQNNERNTSQIGAFAKLRARLGVLVLEPGIRVQTFPPFGTAVEPRLQAKVNVSEKIRLKFAGGYYAQALMSAQNEKDVVNFFTGYLYPDGDVYDSATKSNNGSKLTTSIHAIGGVEIDLGKYVTLNVEPYYKNFPSIVSLNRNKVSDNAQEQDKLKTANFVSESGNAYGIDLTGKYQTKDLYIYLGYSYAYVERFDGLQTYYTTFDRRHNANMMLTYEFDFKKDVKEKRWQFSARWNVGSGFPFTQTQGFYQQQDFSQGIGTNIINGDQTLGIVYDQQRNGGRLPWYHRLDVSVKRIFEFGEYSKLELILGATNIYNRQNIFYFDRVNYNRVDQLPVLPTLSANLTF